MSIVASRKLINCNRILKEMKRDFIWTQAPEPHAKRRADILRTHPEIAHLNGPDWRSKYICFFSLVIPQICLSVFASRLSWPTYLFVAYAVGATITQALFLAIHELAHNLFFRKPSLNRIFSYVVNMPIGIPFAIAFRSYHLDHHKAQGEDGIDTDVPSQVEGRIFASRPMKLLWLNGQIIAYAIRPILTRPLPITTELVCNWLCQVIFDIALCATFGPAPLGFLLLCVFLAGGLHPCAGHFVSEHYVFGHSSGTQETYSYYGPLNRLTWNVGYHNEHHDFPYIPWSRLPCVRRIAPEFYDNLHAHSSWCAVLYAYVMRHDMGPHSRIKRLPRRD